jgi:hypothetical protein
MNRTRPLVAFAAVAATAGLLMAANHDDQSHAANHHAVPACATEDSPGPCVWDSPHGLSFVRTSSGAVHYLHPAADMRRRSEDVAVCARAAFLADDWGHTHTGARAERRAVAACAARVGGF